MWDLIVSVTDHCLSFYFRPTKRLTSTLASAPPVVTDNYRWVITAETTIFQYIQLTPKR